MECERLNDYKSKLDLKSNIEGGGHPMRHGDSQSKMTLLTRMWNSETFIALAVSVAQNAKKYVSRT